jgi:hypothetical protein
LALFSPVSACLAALQLQIGLQRWPLTWALSSALRPRVLGHALRANCSGGAGSSGVTPELQKEMKYLARFARLPYFFLVLD